jgi:hypothetical protein
VKINSVPCSALIALAGLGLLFSPIASRASVGVGTGMASVPLVYNGPETLWLGASVSSGTVTFPQGGGPAPSVVSISTEYMLNQGRVLTIEAGFNGPTALSDGVGNQIPAQAVSATFSSDGGVVTNNGACDGPTSGQTQIVTSSCGYVSYAPVLLGQTSGSHTDTMTLSMNPSFTAPGNYAGVLFISAQAN